MKPEESDNLLNDVLAESGGLREAVLEATLARVRRRKLVRRAGAMLAGIALAGLLPWAFYPTAVPTPAIVAGGSRAAPAPWIIETRSLESSILIKTPADRAIERITTAAPRPGIEQLTDEQLLTMLGDRMPALVRHDGKAELILVNAGGD